LFNAYVVPIVAGLVDPVRAAAVIGWLAVLTVVVSAARDGTVVAVMQAPM